jgi:hypothetical protein
MDLPVTYLMLKMQAPGARPLQQVLTGSRVSVMALVHIATREVAGSKACRGGTLALISSSTDTKTATEDSSMWREVLVILFIFSLLFFFCFTHTISFLPAVPSEKKAGET